jgi:hypothetical protein
MTIFESQVLSQFVNALNWFQSSCHIPVKYKVHFNVSQQILYQGHVVSITVSVSTLHQHEI